MWETNELGSVAAAKAVEPGWREALGRGWITRHGQSSESLVTTEDGRAELQRALESKARQRPNASRAVEAVWALLVGEREEVEVARAQFSRAEANGWIEYRTGEWTVTENGRAAYMRHYPNSVPHDVIEALYKQVRTTGRMPGSLWGYQLSCAQSSCADSLEVVLGYGFEDVRWTWDGGSPPAAVVLVNGTGPDGSAWRDVEVLRLVGEDEAGEPDEGTGEMDAQMAELAEAVVAAWPGLLAARRLSQKTVSDVVLPGIHR